MAMFLRNKCGISAFVTAYILIFMVFGLLGYYATSQIAPSSRINAPSESSTPLSKVIASDMTYYDLPRLSIALQKGDESAHMQMDIALEIPKNNLETIRGYEPRILDRLNSFFAKVSPSQIRRPDALPWLRSEVLNQVNSVGAPALVHAVLLRQLVII